MPHMPHTHSPRPESRPDPSRDPNRTPTVYGTHPTATALAPAIQALKASVGQAEFSRMARAVAEDQEAILRRRDPNHPMLVMLDRMRAEDAPAQP